MTRLFASALACAALIAAPVAAQTATIKNSAPILSQKTGKPAAKTWADWWAQLRGLPNAKPFVGDAVPPELGVNLDKIPASVPSNFNTAGLIESGWPATTKATEGVGAFRFLCSAGDVKRDDPIVYPGQPGKSHLHQFFGNTLADANSTYTSLRSTGDSTCVNKLNRSAYWIPAMLDGTGKVVRPDYVVIYYKSLAAADPQCKAQGAGGCVPLPRGLRYIFGYDLVTGKSPTGAFYYDCQGPTAKPGHYPLIADVAPNCGPGNRAGVIISSPQCWDGKHLDSPNHRDHMAYPPFGYTKCPDTHPYTVPVFSLAAWYSTDVPMIGQPGSVATWSLSSDSMNMGGKMVQMPAGSTFHADWFGAWDDDILRLWQDNCINKLLSCNSGDLGNGTALKQSVPFKWTAEPRTVPIPAS